MKTILVLAQHPDLAEGVRAALNPAEYRVIHRVGFEDAEPLLSYALLSACVLDVDMTQVQGLWIIEKLRRRAPRCPIIVFTSAPHWEWEEEAYVQGVAHVLHKPVRPRMLMSLFERLWATAEPAASRPAQPAPPPPSELPRTLEPAAGHTAILRASSQTLEVLRDFSAILSHSLDAQGMLRQFLLLLREILGVNRAAIFLRQPVAPFGGTPSIEESRRLRSACAIGLSHSLLDHLELSTEAGIGGHLFRSGRILRRHSEEARADAEIQKEFELLSGQVAVPILDREALVGVAVFDGRLTGEPLMNGELELIFHLLEQLGLAIKNIWLHDQVAANHQMMADILRELSSACVVVSRDLTILHANKMARKHFAPPGRHGEIEFTDLPQILGAKVYQVLKTGTALETFKYQPDDAAGKVFNVTIVPFQRQGTALPNSALLTVEDRTQTEQLQKLEIETASLRLMKSMADRLAHEIGNALVPLSTHQQLLADKYRDPEFRASLDLALADSVKRIARLTNQMRFLARDNVGSSEAFPLGPLLEEAYQEAQKYHPVKSARLKYEDAAKPVVVTGDRAALKHALAEVLLNALQANPSEPKIGVRLVAGGANGNGSGELQIEIQDNGAGFTPEAAQKAPAPFFTTRNVGLGLGLTVTRKILETHHGKLEIVPPKTGHAGIVRISLPLEAGGNPAGS